MKHNIFIARDKSARQAKTHKLSSLEIASLFAEHGFRVLPVNYFGVPFTNSTTRSQALLTIWFTETWPSAAVGVVDGDT